MKNEPDIDFDKVEHNIVEALLEAAALRPDETNNYPEVRIKRGDKNLFTFKIRSLNEDEWQKCRRQNLKNRGRMTEELNNARFMSQVIFEATIDEDKERLWKNKEAWKKFNATSGIDIVNAVLTPAEKTAIVETISRLGGFDDENLDDLIRN